MKGYIEGGDPEYSSLTLRQQECGSTIEKYSLGGDPIYDSATRVYAWTTPLMPNICYVTVDLYLRNHVPGTGAPSALWISCSLSANEATLTQQLTPTHLSSFLSDTLSRSITGQVSSITSSQNPSQSPSSTPQSTATMSSTLAAVTPTETELRTVTRTTVLSTSRSKPFAFMRSTTLSVQRSPSSGVHRHSKCPIINVIRPIVICVSHQMQPADQNSFTTRSFDGGASSK
ncbi:Hypothetical protein, putative [Bodo saltans]|uniref:Uncharacterized protein n=1 Tax=Bodo saltans TaxID=75058 RepID=A0A0S4J713_BODSA|nr:Hypothetical protein, putative [Bodo saltans]|eukprot:CUG85705.1 Hypothetical protein, putative [Bodo saltans]